MGFTVTKAYENKVSDLISVSRVASYIQADGGSLAGVINSPLEASTITWSGTDATYGCGSSVKGSMNPGTYYNVRTVAGASGAGAGAGAVLMVVVGGDGEIHEVQVTSGGNGLYKSGDTVRFADKRLHASMALGGNTECIFQVGDMKTTKSMSSPLKSAASGIIADTTIASSDLCITVTEAGSNDGCGSGNLGAKYQNVPVDASGADEDTVKGIRFAVECTATTNPTIEKLTVLNGGLGGIDAATGTRGDKIDAEPIALSGTATVEITSDCINDFYYQFGFYNTNTPRWNRDIAQNNYNMGVTPKDEQVALYGMKNHMQYQFKHGSANQATNHFYGLGRDTFSDLNAGLDYNMAGYSIRDSTNEEFPQMTASVLAGENGQNPTSEFMEHAEKYAYIGKGYDKLTVTPLPDAMTKQKITIQYTGPSAGCDVTEVDRGTHESAECSGRGNCDHSTGTCVCDAGYTLEACSEQTVLL